MQGNGFDEVPPESAAEGSAAGQTRNTRAPARRKADTAPPRTVPAAGLRAKGNGIYDASGRQLCVVLASNCTQAQARIWARYIVERENDEVGRHEKPT